MGRVAIASIAILAVAIACSGCGSSQAATDEADASARRKRDAAGYEGEPEAGEPGDPVDLPDAAPDGAAPGAPTLTASAMTGTETGSAGGGGWTLYYANVTFAAMPSVSVFECQLNAGAWAPCTSPHRVNGGGCGTGSSGTFKLSDYTVNVRARVSESAPYGTATVAFKLGGCS